jgi:hypothetical protein
LVTYVEKKKLAGGKTIHVFSVKKDSSNTIKVGAEDNYDSTELDAASEAEELTPVRTTARRSVQELLNSRAKN